MYATPAQFADANKAAFSAFQAFAQKSVEGLEKLTVLNVATVKSAISESSEQFQVLLGAKDPKALADFATAAAQPNAEKVSAYAKSVYAITNDTATELTKLVEKQFADGKAQFTSAVETMSKNAPAGSEGLVSFVQQAMTAANGAIEQATKATKQAAEFAVSNMEKAAAAAPAARAKKAA